MTSLKRRVQAASRIFNPSRRMSGERVPGVFQKALFNFTIDFELAWGNANVGGKAHSFQRRVESGRRQAENFGPFVEMLDKLGFPVSWAVLGRLADPEGKLAASLEPASKFAPSWAGGDWYQASELLSQPREIWDGRPYLKRIQSLVPSHEVLSHGYAHIDYTDPATTREVALADIQLSTRALQSAGIAPRGFVYPCNQHGYQELLPEQGYRIVRGPNLQWHGTSSLPMTPIGFWISPGVMNFRDVRGFVTEAIRGREFFHPWMHLIECDLKQGDIADFYRPLFEFVLECQAKESLRIVSFGEIADKLSVPG